MASNIRITKIEADYCEGELAVGPDSLNPIGFVHGGLLCTLADTVAGTAVCTRGNMCVTLNCTMNYLTPATGEKIYCVARPQKMGKTICVLDVTLTNDTGTVVATGTFHFFRKDKPIPNYEG